MKELAEAAQQFKKVRKSFRIEMEIWESGGGLVRLFSAAIRNPCRNFPDVLGEGAEVLSDLVTAAMKDAYNKSTFTMQRAWKN